MDVRHVVEVYGTQPKLLQAMAMSLIRRMLESFRRRPSAGYGAEVLFANWVELPAAFREIIRRR